MSCLGLHFALDDDQVSALKAVDEDERVDFVQEEFEEALWSADRSRAQESDKAWDAIHRSLTDGGLDCGNGSYPLNHVILGGEALYDGDDYLLSLKSPMEVRDIASAARAVSRERLLAGYDRINPDKYGMRLPEEDVEYTWEWFQGVVDFYERAAAAGRWVLFTVDQ